MAKFCTNCGATLDDDKKFCTECGASVNDAPAGAAAPPPPPPQAAPQAAPVYAQAATATMPPPQPAYQPAAAYGADAPPPKGSKYELISTGGFIGILLLMCIPFIGIILTIVWACGGCRKLQKRNLARASLIMMAVALVISLVLGFAVKGVVNKAAKEIGITQSESSGGLFSGLSGNKDSGKETSGGIFSSLLGGGEEKNSNGLLGLLGGLAGGEGTTGNSELDELQGLLNQLEGLTGEDMGTDELFDEVGEINKEASKNSDGWPSDLPDFPSGTMNQVEDYRTEFAGTTLEDAKAYIEALKAEGYEYQDFYDFGMSEADMMEYGGWWGYNGKWYISISHAEGVTTIDHVTELPDMSDLLGE